MAARIKKGDKVVVLAGKDRGAQGEVVRVIKETNRAVVQGVNMVTKHVRPSAMGQGGRERLEAPIHLSNLAHIDPSEGKPTRIGFRVLEDGRKVRYAKRSGDVIDG